MVDRLNWGHSGEDQSEGRERHQLSESDWFPSHSCLPRPPASKQLKRILCFIWQEISKWPVVKLWASWYGLFAWPFCFRNFVYAWVLWKLAAGQPPPVPPFCGNRRSFWTLLTISEHREAPSGSLFWIPHMPLSHGEEPQFPLYF